MSAKKKAPARRPAADRPVTIPVPDYVTAAAVPYRVKIGDTTNAYGSTSEVDKVITLNEEFPSPELLFVTIAHEALETAEAENMCKFSDHEELDRAAHVVAEHFLAWVMAQ